MRSSREGTPAAPGRQLAAWRALYGYDQAQAAALFGCTQQMVSGIELGKFNPGESLRRKIEREAKIPISAWDQDVPLEASA